MEHLLMFKRQSTASNRAAHLMLVASVIDGLRRETSGIVDDATLQQYRRLSDDLRRCAFATPARKGA